jgi:hypothetical protein
MLVATFNDYLHAVASYMDHPATQNWRAGQCAFNLLVRVRGDIAELVRGSDMDPFHRDANLPAFYDFVARHWGV